MICAVMQPTYLPWAGYFNLISKADIFVFLDDAQYERGSWQNRNRVLVSGNPHWLTVPVMRDFLGAGINIVRTDEKLQWRRKHQSLLQQVYGKHAHGPEALLPTDAIGDQKVDILADLNISIILDCCRRLGIGTRCVRASELSVHGRRTERLIRICNHLGCDEYLSPPGARMYLADDQFEKMTDIRLSFNEYMPQPYVQEGSKQFVSHLSIIDVAANIGWAQAGNYVRNPGYAADQDANKA